MPSLEDKLKAPFTVRPVTRDMLHALLLIVLSVILIPAIICVPGGGISDQRYLNDVVGNMFSIYLLPAMGFGLCLRRGIVDLSVWVVSSIGGLIAAALINTGLHPSLAFFSAAFCGAGLGLLAAVMVVKLRIPSFIATLVTAGTALLVCFLLACHPVDLGPDAIDRLGIVRFLQTLRSWSHSSGSIMLIARVLIVLGIYLLVLAVTHLPTKHTSSKTSPTGSTYLLLAASGWLSAMGGAVYLLDSSSAPLPPQMLIGDLRIAAAPLLAGALFLGGRGRSTIVMLSLPVVMLLVTVWRQEVWLFHRHAWGFHPQLVLLIGMTIVMHLAMLQAARLSSRRSLAVLSAGLTAGGIVIIASSAWVTLPLWRALLSLAWPAISADSVRNMLHLSGVLVWLLGAITLMICRSEHRSEITTD